MSIRVIAQPNPFNNHRIEQKYESGQSLDDILCLLEIDKNENAVYISVNGDPTEDFSLITSNDDLILIKVVPSGDGVSNEVGFFQTLGVIALAGIGIATGGVGFIVAGLVLGGLTVAGIDVVASFASLFDAAGIPSDPKNPTLKGDPSNYLRGGTNSIKKDGDIPVIFGRHRYYPYQIAEPYSVYNLNTYVTLPDANVDQAFSYSQEIRQLFLWGHKEVDVIDGTLKRGDRAIEDIDGTLVYNQSTGEYGNKAVKYVGVGQRLKSYKRDPDNANAGYSLVRVFMPSGLTSIEVTLVTGSFYVFYYSTDRNDDTELRGATPRTYIQYGLYDETLGAPVTLGSDGTGQNTNPGEEDYNPVAGHSIERAVRGETVAPGGVITPLATKYVLADNLDPTHQYTVFVGKTDDDITDEASSRYNDRAESFSADVTLAHIIGISDKDVIPTETANTFNYANLVLEDVQQDEYGSNVLTGEIDNFNAEVITTLPIWNGVTSGPTGWTTTAETSNPASAYLYVLQGAINKRPALDSEINWESLEEWYTFCEDESLECNLVIDNPGSIESILATIATTGRAAPYFEDNYGVIVDQERLSPMQMITNKNSIGMTSDRRLSTELHAVTYEYIDGSADGQFQTAYTTVYKDGYNRDGSDGKIEATKIISQSMPGVTSLAQVEHLGKYYLNCEDRRVETLTVTMDAEYVLCRQGDLVTVSYDELLQGLERGRIREVTSSGGNVLSVTLDEYVTLEVGKSYGFVVRVDDNTQTITISVDPVLAETTTNVLTLETPAPYDIQAGDLYTFGEADNVLEEYLVLNVSPTEDLKAQLSLISYSPEVYLLDDITSWTPSVSIPGEFEPSMILDDFYEVDEVALTTQAEIERINTVVDPSLKYAIKTGIPSATLLVADVLELKMSDNYLYYVDKNDLKVYRRTTLVSATPTLIINEPVKEIAVDADDTILIYSSLTNGNKLYLYDLVQTTTTQITNVVSTNPVIIGDTIAYINREDENKVYNTQKDDILPGEILIDYPTTSFDYFNGIITWMSPEKSSIYNKSIFDGDLTNYGGFYKGIAATNIISSNPSLWFTTGLDVTPIYVDANDQIAYINNQPFYGDVSRHAMDTKGNYTFVTPRGEVYFADLSGVSNQARLDAEVDIELNYVDGDLIENDTRIYNISVADIDAFAWNDDIAGIGIPEGTIVTFVGSNFIVMSKKATATIPNNPIEITGTRLVLDANKVIIPGTVEAGLLATDAINSLSRVPDGKPNAGQQLYQHELDTGKEFQYNEEGELIRYFAPDYGLWLKSGIYIGGSDPIIDPGTEVPENPSFENTQNKTWVQNTYPSTALDNELWFVVDNDVVEGSDTYLQNVLYAKRSSSPDVWEATTNYELRGTTYRLADNPPTVGAYPLLQEGDYWFNTGTVAGTYAINTLYVLVDLGTNEWETVTAQNVEDFANSTTTTYYDDVRPTSGIREGDLWVVTTNVETYLAGRTYVYPGSGTTWNEATPGDLASLDGPASTKLSGIEENATNSFVLTDATEPTTITYPNLVEGWLWNPSVDNATFFANTLYRYSGSSWEKAGAENVSDGATQNTIIISATEPTTPSTGTIWQCTADIGTAPDYDYYANTSYTYNGASWDSLGPTGVEDFSNSTTNMYYGNTEPTTNLREGDTWYVTADVSTFIAGRTYVYDGVAWEESATKNAFYKDSIAPTTDIFAGDLWYCTTNITEPVAYTQNTTYYYDGTNWIIYSPEGVYDYANNTTTTYYQSTLPVDGDSPDGLHIGDTFKPTADIGTDPIDYYATRTYVYDGTNWPEATPSNLAELDSAQNDKLTDIEENATNSFVLTDATEPTTGTYTNLVEGWLWNPSVDNDTFFANTLYRYSGTAWEVSGAENVADGATNTAPVFRQATVPSGEGEVTGSLWTATADIVGPPAYSAGRTYSYDGVDWNEATPGDLEALDNTSFTKLANIEEGATKNTIIISATEPLSPSTGTIWQCTADIGTGPDYDYYANTSYTYNGASWDTLGPTGVQDFSNSTTNMYYGNTEPTTNLREGDTWYVTEDVSTFVAGRTYVYDGATWEESATKNFAYKSTTVPTGDIFVGDTWYCTADITGPPAYVINTLYSYDGTNWITYSPEGVEDGANSTATTYVQATEPTAEKVGDMFKPTVDIVGPPAYDSNRTYVWDDSNWIEATPSNLSELDFSQDTKLNGIEEGATNNVYYESATEPTSPSEGDLWACTADVSTFIANTTYIYTGGSWVAAGPTGAADYATDTPDTIVSASVPTGVVVGTTWLCTTNVNEYLANNVYVLESASPDVWQVSAPNTYNQPTSPDYPQIKDLWKCTSNRAVLTSSGNEVDIDYWVYTYPASPTAGEYIFLYDTPILILHGTGPEAYDAIYQSGLTYRYDGNSWEAISDTTADYLNQGGAVGHDGGAGNSWGIDASGKLTANGASIVGSMEAIAVDELTRTLVDDGSVEFFTRALTTDPWTTAGSIRGGYDGTDPVLIVPQDFRIGLMTVGLGKGNVSTNVALGINTLSSNATGSDHVAVGNSAMKDVTGGSRSIAIGSGALFKSTTPTQNIAIGHSSMGTAEGGDYNIGIGAFSLDKTTIGTYNVAIGSTSLQNNTEGNKNVSIGEGCLQDNTTGSTNVGIGDKAFTKLISGDYNIGIGPSAGFSNTTGSDNIFIGRSAGALNTGSSNVYIGRSAGSSPTSESNTMRLGSNSYINQSYIAGAGQFLDGHMMEKYTGAVSTNDNIFDALHPQLPANDYGISAFVRELGTIYSVLFVRISSTRIDGYFSGSSVIRSYTSGSGSSSSITELFF